MELKRIPGLRFAAVAALCLGPAVPVHSEQRFSQSTDVVVVEVPVHVLRDGKPVGGLTANDFEIYEGRSRQPITGFETLDLTAATAAGAPADARRLPMSARRRFVLLFDLGFSSAAQMARARAAAKDLLHGSFHPADLVAVAAYLPSKGPQLVLGFTPNRRLVERAIDRLSPVQSFSQGTHSIHGDIWNLDSDNRYGNTKVTNDLERMLEGLRRADCVIESVDIGGVRASADDLHAARNPGADGLFTIANSTGGEYLGNFNNLSLAMAKVLDRTSLTYVLSFQPDVKRDGQYHKLRVELKNPQGARVVYRRGYYAPKPYAQENRLARTLRAAGQVISGQEGGAVAVSVLAAPFQTAGEKAYVPVLIEIDGASLAAGSPGNALPTEVYAYAMDAEGTVVDYFGKILALDLSKVGGTVRRTGIKLFGDFDLAPGSYSVRVLVRNGQTGASGLRVASLAVPAFAAGTPVLLPPFFPEPPNRWLMIRQTKARQEEMPYPFMVKDRPYIPASKPVLTPGQEAVMALVGYGLGAGPLTARAMVMTADGKEAGEGDLTLSGREAALEAGPERLAATYRPPALPPGEYELLVTLSDPAGRSETSATVFVVPAGGGADR
jgi:hypothetical protein